VNPGRRAPAPMVAVIRRPDLWRTAAVVGARLVPRRWWRRWPPLPWPPPGYRRFRLETMYGDGRTEMSPADLIAYLEWCRRMGSAAM
jgi:hypothetical protein